MLLINVDHRRIIIGSQIMIIDHFKVHGQVANSMDQLSRLLTYPKLLGVEEGAPPAYRVCNGITSVFLQHEKLQQLYHHYRHRNPPLHHKNYHYHNYEEVRWEVLSLS